MSAINALAALPARDLPAVFVHAVRRLQPPAVARVAAAIVAQLDLARIETAADEAFAQLLAADADSREAVALGELQEALRERVIAEAARPFRLVPTDRRIDPIPAALVEATKDADDLVGFLSDNGPRGLGLIRASAPIACTVEPVAWDEGPDDFDGEAAERQAGDFAGALASRCWANSSVCVPFDGIGERSLRFPGLSRLLIIAPIDLIDEARRRRQARLEGAR